MREREVQDVLLVRAFEEEDREARLLPRARRTAATRIAREQPASGPGAVLCHRASVLRVELTDRIPGLARLLRLARMGRAPLPVIVGTAAVAGLLANALGPHREVNLLSVPLLGMLAWNLVAYVVLAASALGLGSSVRGPATGVFHWILDRIRAWKPRARITGVDARAVSSAIARFVELWRRHAGGLLAARVRRVLHVGAVVFAAGALGGMYLRGLVFEYRVTWESTFLETESVQTMLDWLLGPAAVVLGVNVPEVGPLRGPDGGGAAALWIHLYAVTTVAVVLLPRAVLAAFHGLRARRLAADLPLDLDGGYYRRVLAPGRGSAVVVDVVPYSFDPEPVARARLKSLLHDFFGARADVRVRAPLAYGEEPEAAGQPDAGAEELCTVVVFNLAQPPESEVHGGFLQKLGSGLDRGARLLVIVDGTTYRQRVATIDRWIERARAWRRVTSESGRTAVVLDLDEADGIDRALDAMACALRPAEAETSA
jgi:hypothetical protein